MNPVNVFFNPYHERATATLPEAKRIYSAISPSTFTAEKAGTFLNADIQLFGFVFSSQKILVLH